MNINQIIAGELGVSPAQVNSAVSLLDEGATVPFIARYRKEVTQGLDDAQLRQLESRLSYLRELDDRRGSILKAIEEQGKLTPDLEGQIKQVTSKTELEDLYLPYKKKRRTKAQIAREAGLEPLAKALLEAPELDPEAEAANFVNAEAGFADTAAVLDGAKQILMETFAEDAALTGRLREYVWEQGVLASSVVDGKQQDGQKFSDYFEFEEPIRKIPSHRALALFRGRNEDILNLSLDVPKEAIANQHPCEAMIARHFGLRDQGRKADKWLMQCVTWTWKIKLQTRIDVDLKLRLREQAEEAGISVFAKNLSALLLAAPAGSMTTMGLDPGIRTGVKVAVVDATGKLLDTATVYPHPPRRQWDESIHLLAGMLKKYKVNLVAIGNGTASRETDKLVADLMSKHKDLAVQKMVVSEAGASVYSASELASKEFPELDVSLRGAVSIARRLQDPLAELVKIDPKSIGVGQYQHDVNQTQLGRALDGVVEDCVNAVGVDLNSASAELLAHVSGLSKTLAQNIVAFRDENGPFDSRKELMDVPRLGAKTFEQAAGFLRVREGSQALDASAVHPEAYPLVNRIASATDRDLRSLIGDATTLRKLNPAQFTDDTFGLPTVRDILSELEKPGRDPRPEFKTAAFKEGVESLQDLKEGMVLEGVVTNVTNFGAFVDVGVHQDGLVHISVLADKFVKDPHEVVAAGDVVKVKVMQVDVARKRIGLSMRLDADPRSQMDRPQGGRPPRQGQNKRPPKTQAASSSVGGNAMAAAFSQARKKQR